jgi:hypothetical protein
VSLSTNVTQEQAPEREVARDLVKRGLWVAPFWILLCGAIWGVDGAASAAYGLGIVLGNFLLAAAIITVTARISPAAVMGGVLFGFLIRLGVILVAILLVVEQDWVNVVPLGITIILFHLGLLFWETGKVSASLAFPGLKPTPNKDGR